MSVEAKPAVRRFVVRGVNSDHDTCCHCGKTGLKRVVWVEWCDADGNPDSDPEPLGTSCAAKLRKTTATRITREAEQADRDRIAEEQRTVHNVGESRSAVDWVVNSVSQHGLTPICRANGNRPDVAEWAEKKFPGLIIEITHPIFPARFR